MNIIVFLLIGLVAGWAAGHFVQGRGLGPFWDIVVGIVGAFVGGFIFSLLGLAPYGIWGSAVMSTVGAVAFLFFIRLFFRSRSFRS